MMTVLLSLIVLVAGLFLVTVAAVVRMSSRRAPVARDLLQAALPILLAMLAALISTVVLTRP